MASTNATFLTKRMADAYFTGTYKMLLVSSLPSEADFDSFDFRSDIANEVPNSGTYVAGGAAVTCSVGAVDTVNNRTAVTIGSPAPWTGATIASPGGWIYKDTGNAATDELIGFGEFTGGMTTSTAGTFTATVNTPLYVTR